MKEETVCDITLCYKL